MSILSAIPVELFTGAIAGALTFAASIMAMKQKAKAEQQRILMANHKAAEASRVRAEGGTAEDKASKRWTRRFIAITATLSILVVPMVAPMLGLNVTHGWTEMSGGFWPIIDPTSHMVWHQVSGGVVITPLHSHTLLAVLGFYFGSAAAESARI